MRPGGPHVTALGGGHGLAVTLAAARKYAGAVTAIVSVADDGGSSGRLREMTGIPAPGDLRRCLGALADPDSVWVRAFEYRFPAETELAGHALGNLVIAVLAEVSGDFATALEHAARLLKVEGRVLAATTVPVDLVARIDGAEVVGQVNITDSPGRIERLWFRPEAPPAPPEAVEAVVRADQVILGPGSLYTSVLACAVVPELTAAIAARSGGRVFVANLRADEPEAGDYRPAEQLRVLLDHGIAVDVMIYDPTSPVASSRRGVSSGGGAFEGGGRAGGGRAGGGRAGGGRAGGGRGGGGRGGGGRGGGGVEDIGPTVRGVRCIPAAVARADGAGHDPDRLAAVLASLAAARP